MGIAHFRNRKGDWLSVEIHKFFSDDPSFARKSDKKDNITHFHFRGPVDMQIIELQSSHSTERQCFLKVKGYKVTPFIFVNEKFVCLDGNWFWIIKTQTKLKLRLLTS